MNVSRFISTVLYFPCLWYVNGFALALPLHTVHTHIVRAANSLRIPRVLDDCLYPCFVHFIPIQKRYLYVYCKSDNPNGIRVIRIVISPTHCCSHTTKILLARLMLEVSMCEYFYILYLVSSLHLYIISVHICYLC